MASFLKTLALLGLKYSGCFRLARRLTSRGVRILCYHGIAVADEHRFRGRLFMGRETFQRRMRLLERLGYPVISLSEAVKGLGGKAQLPKAPVVLTFDDGWQGACDTALPDLAARGMPVTLYVTSYYAARRTQVFNVAIQYLFWKTASRKPAPDALVPGLGAVDLDRGEDRERAQAAALAHGRGLPGAQQRQAFLERLGEALGVDVLGLKERGAFMLGEAGTLRALAAAGVDLQLHTHRHAVKRDGVSVLETELADNRRFLEPLVARPLSHFCYPSGVYDAAMWPQLERLGIESATTCEGGFNYADTPRLGLKRILDEEQLTDLEFEAEMSGVLELWKGLKRARHVRQLQAQTG